MIYDFNQHVDLTGFGSVKQEATSRIFGESDLLPLWVADMDFQGPQEVIEALRRRVDSGIYGYSMRTEAMDEAVIGWMDRRHGWRIQKEWLCHSPGVVTALAACVQSFTAEGDAIVIQPPVYPPFSKVVTENGRKLVTNPLRLTDGRYEMDLEDLEAKIEANGAKMLILCSPHNPVGRVWSEEELAAVIAICRRHGVMIISDEIHADLALPSSRHTVLAKLMNEDERFVICMAPSKTFNMAGLQSSFIIIPNEEIRKAFTAYMERLHIGGANAMALTAAEAAYRHGDEWLDQALRYIAGNMDYLMDYVAAHMPELEVVRPEGTYLVWMDFRAYGLSPVQLSDWMTKTAKVALNAGYHFGAEGEGFMRLNAAAPRAVLAEALQRIREALPGMPAPAEAEVKAEA
ncbi:MalY/PatB family protein [Cohnella lubricantis]|uniref:cysteine-S-conjugate beta-lyase n=1 Tax=Cohnella lubricantis TaxID=2163172 RepID=A0A841TCD4_9BACL|nr:MalY/PatB family protein [Cohnella lubricantis]MBB6678964.1 pyridoxal phosphate-dependent aminotransferase [Cohnella lubricantis]MBP2118816.1 cystathionine beta-lyase [Cohnella lubricantis]